MNFGLTCTDVNVINPYFEDGGNGTDKYGNAGVGSSAKTITGQGAYVVGGYFANYTGGGTNPTPAQGSFTGSWTWPRATQFSMGSGAATTFSVANSTGNVTLQAPTAATSGANVSSPTLQLGGNIWNGSASVADTFTVKTTYASGANPLVTFNIAHSTGTTGGSQIVYQAFTVDGAANTTQTASVNATALANVNSPFQKLQSSYWNGCIFRSMVNAVSSAS
jgi:hypothetical protein